MVGRSFARGIAVCAGLICSSARVHGAPLFQFPTANHALLERGHEEQFFVGTVGKPWSSGCFGCVRSDGWQMHEGLDIRCLERDKRGEPTDPVMATADGTVVYVNNRPSLSNYGNYIVLRHHLQGLEIYSLYAHLREAKVKVGQAVQAGSIIGIMGHTSNTREAISKERAHVHFEIDLFVNDHFTAWFKKLYPKERDDHGVWNGQNLLGLDPQQIFLQQRELGNKFSLLDYIRGQNELCRVRVRASDFPWIKRYAVLVRPNPVAGKEGVAGYDLTLNFNGIPVELVPRAESEFHSKTKYQLLSVNEAEYHRNPCRRLVVQKGKRWELGHHGTELLDLITN